MRKALRNESVQSFVSAILCILLGLLIGYIVLLFINPSGAGESILNIIKNFFTWSRPASRVKQLGNTLAKSMPLILCSLSILFSYKVGLFNIGTAGQYVAGACASLYAALAWGWGWFPCMIFAVVAGCRLNGSISSQGRYDHFDTPPQRRQQYTQRRKKSQALPCAAEQLPLRRNAVGRRARIAGYTAQPELHRTTPGA